MWLGLNVLPCSQGYLTVRTDMGPKNNQLSHAVFIMLSISFRNKQFLKTEHLLDKIRHTNGLIYVFKKKKKLMLTDQL